MSNTTSFRETHLSERQRKLFFKLLQMKPDQQPEEVRHHDPSQTAADAALNFVLNDPIWIEDVDGNIHFGKADAETYHEFCSILRTIECTNHSERLTGIELFRLQVDVTLQLELLKMEINQAITE